MLHALRRETLRRHPGTEALTAAHDASAHTAAKDKADHDREQQTSFDHMSSDQFVDAAIAELKSWLFTALQTPEAQRGVVSPEVEEPPTGDRVTAEAPVSTIRPDDAVLPDTAPKTAVVTLVGSDAL